MQAATRAGAEFKKAPEFFPSLKRKLRIVGDFSLPSLSPGGGGGGGCREILLLGRDNFFLFYKVK